MRSRAERRHHEERIKDRVKDYYGGERRYDPRRIGQMAHTRKLCSCWMCGNPRKHFGELTIQERRFREMVRADRSLRSITII